MSWIRVVKLLVVVLALAWIALFHMAVFWVGEFNTPLRLKTIHTAATLTAITLLIACADGQARILLGSLASLIALWSLWCYWRLPFLLAG